MQGANPPLAPCSLPRDSNSKRFQRWRATTSAPPLQARVEAITGEVELDDDYETERQPLYIARTRARGRLVVTGTEPGSEYLADLQLSGAQPLWSPLEAGNRMKEGWATIGPL